MAWGNVRNEPRREWIEQVIGLFVVILVVVCDCLFTSYELKGYVNNDRPIIYGLVLMVSLIGVGVAVGLMFGLWYFAHEVGEIVSGWLTNLGWDPRPNPRENTWEYKKTRRMV